MCKMLLWVLGQQGARGSHPGAQCLAFPAQPVLDSPGSFVLALWPWTAWRQVLQWERGLGQGAGLWSLTQTCSVPPVEERRGDSWLLQLTPSWKKLLSHGNM